ncbi:FHA domain-containing protein [Cognatilysobacter terrigena]|uniref:FHA domain-containing protein n=1 Tax=Cognatilysobacter terrigena TaxID=2488749 RepID=UPI001FE52F03|nr:FHA domain-containing protein [Lysobacter terrigena]
MQARLIAYIPEGAAIARIVAPGDRLRIGRAPEADLLLSHVSVSRRHAELEPQVDGTWRLLDLDSKNGSFVDGARINQTALARSCWLRFGDVHCEFAMLDTNAAEEQARRWQERRHEASRMTARLEAMAQPREGAAPTNTLLEHSLRAVLELAGCTRGFVLIAGGGRYRVATSIALDASLATGPEFTGSLGAVAQALRTRAPVVFNDIGQDAWLSGRESVVRGGLRTLVALPLLDGNRALGAVYADRREAGPPLTTLDVELLQAFAERCALWLAARGEAQGGVDPPSAGDWSQLLAGHAPTR